MTTGALVPWSNYLSITRSDGGLFIQVSGGTLTSRTLREMFEGPGMQVSERSLIISRIDGDKLLTWELSLCIRRLARVEIMRD